MTDLRVILCNCSPDEAAGLAEALVDERYAACVNVLPGVMSYYRWNDEMCAETESTLLIKTTADRYDELEARLQELHSYDVPEIIALHPTRALEAYANWVAEETS